jgi:hypothetical protein
MVSEFKGCSMHIFFCFCVSVDLVSCYTTLVHCYEKKSSDGHQLQQYQQNEQSPLILSELTEHINDPDK